MTTDYEVAEPCAPVTEWEDMHIDYYPGSGVRLDDARQISTQAEDAGFGSLWVLEAPYEPFGPLAVAAESTTTIGLRTAVAVAFARNPMILAQHSHELARASAGRFVLGVGTQVQAHITRRYSEPWSRPAARMTEYIAALRAIWRAWNHEEALDFRGEFYQHTLMTPMFNPGPTGFPSPEVHLAAVGPRMVEVAVRYADGLVMHPLSSPRFLAERILPAVQSHSDKVSIELSCPVLVATGGTDNELEESIDAVRKQIAFYASTPAYKEVFGLYGEGDRADELRRMSRAGQWDDMAALITDELLNEFAIVAPPDDVRAEIDARFGAHLDRAAIYSPRTLNQEVLHALVSSV